MTRTRPGPLLLHHMRVRLEVRSRLLPRHGPRPGPGPFKSVASGSPALLPVRGCSRGPGPGPADCERSL